VRTHIVLDNTEHQLVEELKNGNITSNVYIF
jgi:hypothetical protein